MDKSQEIIIEIYLIMDHINEHLDPAKRLDKNSQTLLMGVGSQLDSLELVNLVVALETFVENKYGVELMLFELMTSSEKQVWTVEDLAQLISQQVQG